MIQANGSDSSGSFDSLDSLNSDADADADPDPDLNAGKNTDADADADADWLRPVFAWLVLAWLVLAWLVFGWLVESISWLYLHNLLYQFMMAELVTFKFWLIDWVAEATAEVKVFDVISFVRSKFSWNMRA